MDRELPGSRLARIGAGKVGLDDLKALFQPGGFCDSLRVLLGELCRLESLPGAPSSFLPTQGAASLLAWVWRERDWHSCPIPTHFSHPYSSIRACCDSQRFPEVEEDEDCWDERGVSTGQAQGSPS